MGRPPMPRVYVPLQLQSPAGVLNFISTITVFGTPNDIALSELALETFFAADAATMQALRQLGDRRRLPVACAAPTCGTADRPRRCWSR